MYENGAELSSITGPDLLKGSGVGVLNAVIICGIQFTCESPNASRKQIG